MDTVQSSARPAGKRTNFMKWQQANFIKWQQGLADRWGVSLGKVQSDAQWARIAMVGRRQRALRADSGRKPIRGGIAAYAAARGVTVAQLEIETGLTRRTFNRLAKSDNTHRVRDLVAGVAALLAERAQKRRV